MKDEMGGACTTHGRYEKRTQNYSQEHEGKKLHVRPSHRWMNNIGTDLREIWGEGVDWMHLAQDRGQWLTCEHGNDPLGSIKGRDFLD
jgi:hypothetical protein